MEQGMTAVLLPYTLYGYWGSGKTSVKNMAIETFFSSKGNCSLILEENDLKEFDSLKSLS